MKGNKNSRRKKTPSRDGRERTSNKRVCERDEQRSDDRPARNDVSWYTKYPNLAIAAGSFPYPYRPGMTLSMGTWGYTPTGGTAHTYTRDLQIPGVLVLDWMPSIGVSNTATDPASVCAKEIYARVRAAFSGSLDADAPDFIMYLMALDSLFAYIAWMKRIYRVMNAWSPDNYVLPDTLLSSMGLRDKDIVSFRANKTQFWQYINELVLQSRKFTCPAVMDIFNRHYWMSDNVYTDEASINSQFYLFNLRCVYKFAMVNMPDGNPGPGLIAAALPWATRSATKDTLTPTNLYDFGKSLIEALVAWDDAYTINGYLKRAFEGTPMFIVDELPADQPFTPVYEPEVLTQIENSRAVPLGTNGSDWSGVAVSQDVLANAVISNPTINAPMGVDTLHEYEYKGYTIPPVLSARSDQPTVADNIIASRLQAAVISVTASGAAYHAVIQCGTEIPLGWRFMNHVATTGDNQVYDMGTVHQVPILVPTTVAPNMASYLMDTLAMEAFDWHPFVFVASTNVDGTNGQFRVCGDVHNITAITSTDLANLHKICIYSELNAFSV